MSSDTLVIGIIGGTGKMGAFFRTFFEQNNLKVLISGRKTKLTNQELCQQSDIVIISVPANIAVDKIKEIIPNLKKDTLLIDFSSLQEETHLALQQYNGPSASIHPLFGPSIKSLEGQTFSVTPENKNEKLDFLNYLFKKSGAKIVKLTAEEHDKQMALVQALIHFSNISLAKTLSESDTKMLKDLSTPLFRLQSLVFGRVLSQNAELYENILMHNKQFAEILSNHKNNVEKLSEIITKKEQRQFASIYSEVKKAFGSFIEIAENKTTEVLSLIDKQPVKQNHKKVSTDLTKVTVSYLGPEGTYSYQAAKQLFPKTEQLKPVKTIIDVFESVNNGDTDYGVVPSENLIEGAVKDTINSMLEYPINILAEFPLPIHHALISFGNESSQIKVIKSHPQALGQCKNWLKSNFPNIPIEPATSTLAAIEEKNPEIGIIAGTLAAEKYGLNILAEDIGDNPNNQTFFYAIGTSDSDIFKQEKIKAILLLSVYDRVGVLRDILDVFASRKLNLSRIISIPSGQKAGEYLFLIDVGITKQEKDFEQVLNDLKEYCQQIRILGKV